MELKLIELMSNGGWMAVAVFLLYLFFRQDKTMQRLEKWLEETSKRVTYIEKEYIARAEFYRDISGWRSDIKSLEGQILDLRSELSYFRGRQEHDK